MHVGLRVGGLGECVVGMVDKGRWECVGRVCAYVGRVYECKGA